MGIYDKDALLAVDTDLPEWQDAEEERALRQERKPRADKRREIERYWEERRLRRQIEDFGDLD